MTPIQDLLHRIVWDLDFGNAHFVIGYHDRRFDRIVRVTFERVNLARGQHFSFDVIGNDGNTRMIPFHRVREVTRNGELIWQRPAPG
ncbi:MAG TPA: DUF504 domain-containing protein [Massilia sp.]|nr:DUF504 domain-containing protein [Massilia sp.]